MRFEPHKYQAYSIQRIIENKAVALFLDMGLGKTICTLSAINELMYNRFEVGRVLVIAPKKVAESTWDAEADKWEHTKHLRISKVLGSEAKRKTALNRNADVYVINRENVVWLCQYFKWRLPFDMVVLDESSSFKNRDAKRFKALRKIRTSIDRIVELTGTPSSNGLMDLWAQVYLLDFGQRLGRTISAYRNNYFIPDARSGHIVYNYKLLNGSEEKIHKAIGDICFSMSADDWLEMPEKIINVIPVELDTESKARYKMLEREKVLEFGESDVTVGSAAVLSNKLLQLANGAIYDDDKGVQHVHDAKLEALAEIVDANDKPMLVFYSFRHDLSRIQAKFPEAKQLESDEDIKAWNVGKIKMLLAHPASAGYGLNLQAGGSIIVWFGLTWSLEQYQQANGRLYRQGQQETVIIHHLVAKGTADEQVMHALECKKAGQDALLDAVKAKIKEYGGKDK
ncbi:MAG: DEAD/DEAH box helicase [Christensenellaceae bacterium]